MCSMQLAATYDKGPRKRKNMGKKPSIHEEEEAFLARA